MSEVKRYSAQPFSPNGLMFENEFGHYVLFCEYEKLKAENNRLQEQIVYTVDAIKEDMNENSELITKLTRKSGIAIMTIITSAQLYEASFVASEIKIAFA